VRGQQGGAHCQSPPVPPTLRLPPLLSPPPPPSTHPPHLPPATLALPWPQEALTGVASSCAEDFADAVQRAVAPGWAFKGVPQHHRLAHAGGWGAGSTGGDGERTGGGEACGRIEGLQGALRTPQPPCIHSLWGLPRRWPSPQPRRPASPFGARPAGVILGALLEDPVAASMLNSAMAGARFTVRTHVVGYAERVASVWVMLCCAYPAAT